MTLTPSAQQREEHGGCTICERVFEVVLNLMVVVDAQSVQEDRASRDVVAQAFDQLVDLVPGVSGSERSGASGITSGSSIDRFDASTMIRPGCVPQARHTFHTSLSDGGPINGKNALETLGPSERGPVSSRPLVSGFPVLLLAFVDYVLVCRNGRLLSSCALRLFETHSIKIGGITSTAFNLVAVNVDRNASLYFSSMTN